MYMIYTGRRLTMCIVLADFQHGLRALLLYKYTTPQAGVVRLLLPTILTPVTRFGPGGGRQGGGTMVTEKDSSSIALREQLLASLLESRLEGLVCT